MRRVITTIAICAALLVSAGAAPAVAQILAPGVTPAMPPPPAPPPPRIEVPVVPKLDAPPAQPRSQRRQRGSFGDRVTRCLDQAAAAGLGPADRAAYSRACANQ